ncbi:MAG: zinc ribbon domain-containing protein [Armatimonadota bacterium]
MPIYEYRCRKCGQEFEVLVWGFNDGGPKKCDHCGGKLEKMLSPAAVIYKGSGFHTTDYCRKSGDNGDKAKNDRKEKAEEVKSSVSDDKKTEKKEKAKKD